MLSQAEQNLYDVAVKSLAGKACSLGVNNILRTLVISLDCQREMKPSSPKIEMAMRYLFFKSFTKTIRDCGVETYGMYTVYPGSMKSKNVVYFYERKGANRGKHKCRKTKVLVNAINKYSDVIYNELKRNPQWCKYYAFVADVYLEFTLNEIAKETILFIAQAVAMTLLDKYKLARRCSQLTREPF